MRLLRSVTIAGLAVGVVSCGPSQQPNSKYLSNSPSATTGPVSRGLRQVSYDHSRPDVPPAVRAQVLVDTSASMAGFRKIFPPLLHAVDEGLSYSRGLYFSVEAKRTCFFSQRAGVFGCEPRIDGVAIVPASGYTNLDQAIKSAADHDLTIVFTDGVPSNQSSGKDCVGSGVDAACVAQALSDAVRGSPGAATNQLRGIWIVPIIAMYQGTYFAEQPVSPNEFDRNAAESNVQNSFGASARIANPRTGSDGTLLFDYAGPRFILAIVIGEAEVSRAFLQEFYNRTEFSDVDSIREPKSYKSKTAVLPAIEVFPSTVPRQDYRGCQQSVDQRGRIEGDLINCARVAPNRFQLSCRPKPSRASLLLTGAETTHALPLTLLAPAKFGFSSHGVATRPMFTPDATGRGMSNLNVEVSCNSKQPIRCGSDESRVELTSMADIESVSRDVSSAGSEIGRFVLGLSTKVPAMEPHKVYGLADLLENFYKRKLPEAKSTFAALEFCQE